jgi:CubicO group peptidase (beta-lactamase class C family)
MKRIISILIISILIICSFSVQGIFFEKTSKQPITSNLDDFLFDKKIELFMKIAKFPSLSASIIDSDEVTWSNSYGYYDLENMKPASETTIYNIGSITKTITGTALMQLWEQELVDLDEDVNNYLPFTLRNPHFPDDPITFRMLLSHSSSLNNEIGLNGYSKWINFSQDPPFSFYPYPWLKENLLPGGKWYYQDRWSSSYHPGELSVYANVNFDIIAYLVELISGEKFIEYCKKYIFNPLEMHDTSFNLSELDIERVAIPYHYHNDEYLKLNELFYLLGDYTPPDKYWRILYYPVGGLYSTISDLSHFFIAHMNGGIWNNVRILEKDTVEEMHMIQPPGNIEEDLQYYGLAWIVFKDPLIFNFTISGHSGDAYGVSTWMVYLPSENIGAIYFTNGDRENERNPILGRLSMIFFLQLLFKRGGYNLFSHIDLGNLRGEMEI